MAIEKIEIEKMSGIEVLKAFRESKEAIAANTVIKNAIRDHYKPVAIENGGRHVLYVDETGTAHGFETSKGYANIVAGNLEKVLAEYGHTPEEIADIKRKSKGNAPIKFSDF